MKIHENSAFQQKISRASATGHTSTNQTQLTTKNEASTATPDLPKLHRCMACETIVIMSLKAFRFSALAPLEAWHPQLLHLNSPGDSPSLKSIRKVDILEWVIAMLFALKNLPDEALIGSFYLTTELVSGACNQLDKCGLQSRPIHPLRAGGPELQPIHPFSSTIRNNLHMTSSWCLFSTEEPS